MHIGYYEGNFWSIHHVHSPTLFYAALAEILVEDETVIHLCSTIKRDESTSFLDGHQAPDALVEEVLPTASSEPYLWAGHYLYTRSLRDAFEEYFKRWNSQIADNIACYRKGVLLLWFHDAFAGGYLHLGNSFKAAEVAKFCQAMAPTFELDAYDPDAIFKQFGIATEGQEIE